MVSLGHAAFLAIGAYSHAVFLQYGVPFPVSVLLAAAVAAGIGALFGIPALRMTGVYLAVATLAFERIVAYAIEHWDGVTGGLRGLRVPQVEFFGVSLVDGYVFYYVCLAALVGGLLAAANLLRSPTGRAFVAVRRFGNLGGEHGRSSGANQDHRLCRFGPPSPAWLARSTRTRSAICRRKRSRCRHPFRLLLLVVVGGLGSLHGVVFGAIFVGYLPQAIALARDVLPSSVGQIPGLELGVFGAILVLFLVFEPLGIYGRWLKVRAWFDEFPLYRKATFKRQRSYLRTERVH